MRKEYHMIISLTIVILVAGGVLAGTYVSTQKDIARNLENAKKKALAAVLPNVSDFEEKKIDDKTSILTGKDNEGNVMGYGVLLEGGGFQGPIKLMVGFNEDGSEITGIEVLENVETPGLGNRIVEEWFKAQFRGTVPPVEVVKGQKPQNKSQVEAITGATISSKSVANIVNKAHEILKMQLSGGSEALKGEIVSILQNLYPQKEIKVKDEFFEIVEEGKVSGYAVLSKALGYNDSVGVVVVFSKDLNSILSVVPYSGEVLSKRSRFEKFLNSLAGKSLPLVASKLDVVSGATVTTDAIISAINSGFDILKRSLENGQQ